ncbi:MFS transporter [Aliirhizobium cellulosilyticum]|uniref:DHA1 family inner membrane transport protein n=1 Tax=Aliirhizobium cellulosilyticum TaxID=393664 RepID=A0A7W6WPE9_9HYPH|nr:MFS transporter [Rhizobium cellulosilyticum]MBB4348287.1 DHA1 family inner membrane transport protein [Rhizobium cellulosilyticum]MBB4411523.1 DHA1 family inner membrane transport protein [Rhizobium cellulosilyticum]MBB4446213.1 DHA1 family inner membrane transport protein [Rhizobium cellulosilyticum]
MPLALYALTAGAFGIGVTEFVIMGLLIDVSKDLGVSISAAGLLISGYALGVVIGAPILGAISGKWSKKTLLMALMVVFTIGNLACAIAPDYWTLMAARVLTAFAHASFFGVGSVVATSLVAPNKKASAIAIMFTGLTVANILGVPFGTWLGQAYGWRSTFWAVTLIGVAAFAVIALLVPKDNASDTQEEASQGVLAVLGRRAVLLGLLTTVLSWVGVFAGFTYIAPILTQITGFSEAAVSPILLVFGGGLVIGNLAGGWLADRHLMPTIVGSLIALAVVLLAMTVVIHQPVLMVIAIALFGAAAFATVAPLQMWVLAKAEGAGQGLASSFNIAAFNLGNAIGAWLGGAVIDHGPGLGSVTLVAGLVPIAALAVALIAIRMDKSRSGNAAQLSPAE